MSAISAATSTSLITPIRNANGRCKGQFFKTVDCRSRLKQQPSPALSSVLFKASHGYFKLRSNSKKVRRVAPVMEWQDCTVKMEVDVPASVAYNTYLDRESIPKWMPFISKVKPTLNQKIHWRSMEGLPNRGAVRFFPRGPSSCLVELTVSYEVPAILTPVASALKPFLENLLIRGLERFSNFAKGKKDRT